MGSNPIRRTIFRRTVVSSEDMETVCRAIIESDQSNGILTQAIFSRLDMEFPEHVQTINTVWESEYGM